MKKFLLPIFCVFSVVLLACGAMVGGGGTAADVPSKISESGILILDIQKVLDEYYKIEEIKNKLTVKVEAARKELQAMVERHMKLDKEVKDLNEKAENPAIADEAKSRFKKEAEAKEAELYQNGMVLNKFKSEADDYLIQLQRDELSKQMEVIKKVVGEIASEKGAAVVLSKIDQNVVYSDDSLDISKETIKRLNASAPPKVVNDEKAKTVSANDSMATVSGVVEKESAVTTPYKAIK
ncbi:MAG: OmpH family outer membrane protein [Puniceicoccales bacterium]|jgi:Skp family chaperone for outer membrane proteins|nr:OmpH family outer membrane protein [Puniceicoccales bacterium]